MLEARGDRAATVVSGTWYVGYGPHFEEKNLKALVPGSFYTEPPDTTHFARTGNQKVVLQMTRYGPSGTKYVEWEPRFKPLCGLSSGFRAPGRL